LRHDGKEVVGKSGWVATYEENIKSKNDEDDSEDKTCPWPQWSRSFGYCVQKGHKEDSNRRAPFDVEPV